MENNHELIGRFQTIDSIVGGYNEVTMSYGKLGEFGKLLRILLKRIYYKQGKFADECGIDDAIICKMCQDDPAYLQCHLSGEALFERLKSIINVLHEGNGRPDLITRFDIEQLINGIPEGWLTSEVERKLVEHLNILYPPRQVLRTKESIKAGIRHSREKEKEEYIRRFDAYTEKLLVEIQ